MRLSAEAALAKHIAKRHNFQPGDNLKELVEIYADLEFRIFPVSTVDGISLYLKSSERRPNILINSSIAPTRAKFTLAHEFGHVLIPWHFGMIFSNITKYSSSVDGVYREMEAEANRFAAELLMPHAWLESLHLQYKDPAYTARTTRELCDTSIASVIIAVNNTLPAGYVYAAVDSHDGVIMSTSSSGTFAAPFDKGDMVRNSARFEECESFFEYELRGTRHTWLSFEAEQELDVAIDSRSWREILDEIIAATDPNNSQPNIKLSLNGVISVCNNTKPSAEAFYAAARQKLSGRSELYQRILAHPCFNSFLVKRIEEFIDRRK
jgi:Zn-dependent peptidase ImmA (M78 family)